MNLTTLPNLSPNLYPILSLNRSLNRSLSLASIQAPNGRLGLRRRHLARLAVLPLLAACALVATAKTATAAAVAASASSVSSVPSVPSVPSVTSVTSVPSVPSVPSATAGTAATASADSASPWAGFQRTWSQGQVSHLFDIDNDSLLFRDGDGFYTSGNRYTMQAQVTDGGQTRVVGWRIGQDQFTASDIKLPADRIDRRDHPYAAWLYLGLFQETHAADGSHWKWGADIGCIGPCAGGEPVQAGLHRLLRQPLPQGWGGQIRNEPGLSLHGGYAPARWVPAPGWDLGPYLKARLGNIFTDIAGGVTLRGGRLNALPRQAALQGMLRLELRAVGRDGTLQGGLFSDDSPHTVAPKRWVGEAELGLSWQGAEFGLQAGLVRRSTEVRDLPNSVAAQNFARLQLRYTPR